VAWSNISRDHIHIAPVLGMTWLPQFARLVLILAFGIGRPNSERRRGDACAPDFYLHGHAFRGPLQEEVYVTSETLVPR